MSLQLKNHLHCGLMSALDKLHTNMTLCSIKSIAWSTSLRLPPLCCKSWVELSCKSFDFRGKEIRAICTQLRRDSVLRAFCWWPGRKERKTRMGKKRRQWQAHCVNTTILQGHHFNWGSWRYYWTPRKSESIVRAHNNNNASFMHTQTFSLPYAVT